MLCDVDISTPSGKPLAAIRNIDVQKACDQMICDRGWLRDVGLSVNLRVHGNNSPLSMTPADAAEQRKKDEDEIISFVALDIPY
jgi:hypothetical protein